VIHSRRHPSTARSRSKQQLTSNSRRHPSTARSRRTTHQWLIPAAILQPPDQEQLARSLAISLPPPSFNKQAHPEQLTSDSRQAIQPPDQEQLTRDSRRHPSSRTSRTTHQ